ncbi:transcriptional regulator [Burkholderia pseudomallei]|nr:transcriptional regulator [Burkholderia pseudomallei]EEP51839.1 ETS-related transcription factor ERF [Burkholderia pseudomallei MSHR346]EXI98019.1 transcriptional regulator [Burkholderia pseudomallei MSHR6137]ARK56692.1 transcriptional regulator [Burkholderia pseudomallei]ARK71555.1 transcriptional regulator [Burkholderia pseudomallei]
MQPPNSTVRGSARFRRTTTRGARHPLQRTRAGGRRLHGSTFDARPPRDLRARIGAIGWRGEPRFAGRTNVGGTGHMDVGPRRAAATGAMFHR